MHVTGYTKIEQHGDGHVSLKDGGCWTALIDFEQGCSIATPTWVDARKTRHKDSFNPLDCVEVRVGAEIFVAVNPKSLNVS